MSAPAIRAPSDATLGVAAVACARLSVRYPGAAELALRNVDWEIGAGEFALVVGPSGSGKSTLLRCLNGLVPHFSGGEFGGRVVVAGYDTRHYPPRALARVTGFVFQDPEAQLVTTRVDDEIAFGMENLGVPPPMMRERVEEVLELLSITALRHRDPATLSGGERQRVAVAAALALRPSLLALDEPTSQLDPWGADDLLIALTRLNEELGLTIVLAEHRLERAVAHADRMTLLGDDGRIVADGRPREVVTRMDPEALPPLVRLGLARGWEPLPLSIAEGRRATAAERSRGAQPFPPYREPTPPSGPPAIVASGLRVAFGGGAVLRDVDFEAHPGEMVALMGRNGSGKTTLLRALIGLQRVEAGKIRVFGRDAAATHPADLARDVGYVPQNPSSILFAETLRDELAFTLRYRSHGADSDETLARLGLADVADRHPRDLSGGERERAALAAILVGAPRALLLDEPTRGMDAGARRALMALLERLRQDGVTVVMATHDVELAAAAATRIVMLDDGRVIADGAPRAVLSGASAFATQIAKLYGDGSLTLADAPAA